MEKILNGQNPDLDKISNRKKSRRGQNPELKHALAKMHRQNFSKTEFFIFLHLFTKYVSPEKKKISFNKFAVINSFY